MHEKIMNDKQDTESIGGSKIEAATTSVQESRDEDQNEPPNGGVLAWFQVAGSFCLYFNTWGLLNTFGLYQAYYEEDLLKGYSSSKISWIGSIQAFFLFSISTVIGTVYDRGYARHLVAIGSFLTVLGIFTTSICRSYSELILTQGFITGAGFGFLCLPAAVISSQYFTTKRAFATGLASLGGSIAFLTRIFHPHHVAGGVIYPIIFTNLRERLDASLATCIIGIIELVLFLLPVLTFRPFYYPRKKRALFDFSAISDPSLMSFSFAMLFGYMALYVIIFYIQLYATSPNVNMSSQLAFYLLPMLCAGSAIGRIIPNIVADYVGCVNMQIISGTTATILLYSVTIPPMHSHAGTIVFVVLFGLFTGTFVSLCAPGVANLSPDKAKLGGRLSICIMMGGIGALVGSPIAGVILRTNSTHDNWNGLFIWSGALMTLSTLFALSARLLKVGFGLAMKI